MKARAEVAYLNLLRAGAAYLVILLHCTSTVLNDASLLGTGTWWVCNLLSPVVRMGVPLFFMISGYLLLTDPRTLDVKEFYKKRLAKLLPAFLVWDVIYFVTTSLASGQSIDVGRFFTELLQRGSKYHLWFVYQMIGIYLLAPFVKRIVDACKAGDTLWLLGVILLPTTLLRFVNVMLQSVVWVGVLGTLIEGYVGFFLYGYILGSYSPPPRLKGLIYALGVGGFLLAVVGNYHFSSPEELNFFFNEGYSVTHYLTAGAVFLLAKEYTPRVGPGLQRAAKTVAGLSYGIYLSHVLAVEVFKKALALAGVALSPAVYIPASFAFAGVACTAGMYVLSKNKVTRRLSQ